MAKKQPTDENKLDIASLRAAERVKATPVDEVFVTAAAARPAAVRILAEGDSWFAYPKAGLLFGRPSNVIDQLKAIDGDPDLVIHDLSSNGDEAVAMVSGSAKLDLLSKLAKNEYDILLFSGGGNDIVGAYDFEFFLNRYQDGFTVLECVRVDRFERRLSQIRNAYCDLIELVGDYSRNKAIRIVSHTYDIAPPSPQGAEFLGGLLKIDGAKSWMHPYLMTKGITDAQLQKDVVRYMLGRFREMLMSIAMDPGYAARFTVVDTHGLVGANEWRNEIHPTPDGFRKVAKRIFDQAIRPLAASPQALPRVAAARAARAAGAMRGATKAVPAVKRISQPIGPRTVRKKPSGKRAAKAAPAVVTATSAS